MTLRARIVQLERSSRGGNLAEALRHFNETGRLPASKWMASRIVALQLAIAAARASDWGIGEDGSLASEVAGDTSPDLSAEIAAAAADYRARVRLLRDCLDADEAVRVPARARLRESQLAHAKCPNAVP